MVKGNLKKTDSVYKIVFELDKNKWDWLSPDASRYVGINYISGIFDSHKDKYDYIGSVDGVFFVVIHQAYKGAGNGLGWRLKNYLNHGLVSNIELISGKPAFKL